MHDLIIKPEFQRLPVRKVFCLGRNFRDHAEEMGVEAPSEPVVFLKPATAVLSGGGTMHMPGMTEDLHHELELVVILGQGGRDITEESALDHVAGYAAGLDMTMRDVQSRAKERRQPWTVAKGFDGAAPIGEAISVEELARADSLEMSLSVNGEERQTGNTSQMIFSIPFTISWLSRIFTLEAGDCVMMGTPAGVSRVVAGDHISGRIGPLIIEVDVQAPR